MSDLLSMKDFWNKTATRYGEKDSYRPVLIPSSKGLINWYADFLQNRALGKMLNLLSGQVVLDIGCGVGRWSARMATGGASVVGVDLSREMAKKAKQRLSKRNLQGDFVVASVAKLPFVKQSFDSIVSVTVLQHIVEEPLFMSAIKEIAQTVKVGGNVVLLEYSYGSGNDFAVQFPTIVHDYPEAFKGCDGIGLTGVQGVDVSLFLKPFNHIIKKHGKYKDQLGGKSPSLKYVFSAASFYFLASVACVFSLSLDIPFRNTFKRFSEHKVFIFQSRKLICLNGVD
jgi:SAM-dependent methyltransferase